MAVDAFKVSWSNLKCYAFPPFSLLPRVLAKICYCPLNRSSVVNTRMVSHVVTASNPPTNSITQDQSANAATHFGTSPLSGQTDVSRLDGVRRSLQDRDLSENAIKLICASWTPGTEKQYRAAWKKWCCWSRQRNINIFQASVDEVPNFLADCFSDGKSYSAINTYRSALSSTLCPTEHLTVGSHPIITRLFKGIYHLRPPGPRYSSTWDVRIVISYLATLIPPEQLTFKILTLKTIMLCALASAQRAQTLCALDLTFMREYPQSLNFKVAERLKTSRLGRSQLEVVLPLLSSDLSVCPKTNVQAYIARTQSLRQTESGFVSKLFLSHCKPHKPVCSSTIARWIKCVLSNAGIDTSIFKAHSVRSASTSNAYENGIPVQEILRMADWSNEQTFRKFYLRASQS